LKINIICLKYTLLSFNILLVQTIPSRNPIKLLKMSDFLVIEASVTFTKTT